MNVYRQILLMYAINIDLSGMMLELIDIHVIVLLFILLIMTFQYGNQNMYGNKETICRSDE